MYSYRVKSPISFVSYRYMLSYSYQLLLPTPISYSYQLLITSSRYYSLLYISYLLPYQLLLSISLFSCQFTVLLSGNIITYSYHISFFIRYFYQLLVSTLLAYSCKILLSELICNQSLRATPTRSSLKLLLCHFV